MKNEQTSDLEGRTFEIVQSEEQKEKKKWVKKAYGTYRTQPK